MKVIYLLVTLSLFFTGCATTTPGIEHETGTKNVDVFLTINPDYSTDHIKMFQFSIKNNSDEWIEFDDIKVTNDSKEISVIVGARLHSWFETSNLEKQVSDYNTSLACASSLCALFIKSLNF
jgi:hypothetical protein